MTDLRTVGLLALLIVSTTCSLGKHHCTDANGTRKPCDTKDFTGLVVPLGYPLQTYTTTTQDGYILRIFRLQKKNTQIKSGLPVVWLQHGLEDSSDDWVVNEEEKCLAFVLANQGYLSPH